MDEAAFIAHFPDAKRTGAGKYLVKCPAHADRTPSLSLSVMPDGRKLAQAILLERGVREWEEGVAPPAAEPPDLPERHLRREHVPHLRLSGVPRRELAE